MSLAVGTVITGEGRIVFHDVTPFGLHRLCASVKDKYPDLEVWSELVRQGRTIKIWFHRYTEKIVSNVFTGYLWIYWKEG